MMNNIDSICARVESARRDRLRKVVLRRENFIKNSAPYSFIYTTGGHSSVQPSQKLDNELIKMVLKGYHIFPEIYRFDMYDNRKYREKKTLSKEGV